MFKHKHQWHSVRLLVYAVYVLWLRIFFAVSSIFLHIISTGRCLSCFYWASDDYNCRSLVAAHLLCMIMKTWDSNKKKIHYLIYQFLADFLQSITRLSEIASHSNFVFKDHLSAFPLPFSSICFCLSEPSLYTFQFLPRFY